MAKGGVIVKKSRRRIRRFNGDEDESDDEEYIAEEEEADSESYDESLASSSDSEENQVDLAENLADFSGSDHNREEDESDFEYEEAEFEDEEEEEDEVQLKRSKKGPKKSAKIKKKTRKYVSDSEEEDYFQGGLRKEVPDFDEEDDLDLDFNPVEVKSKRSNTGRKKSAKTHRKVRRHLSDSDEEDYVSKEMRKEVPDSDEEDNFDLNTNPVKDKMKKSRSKRNKSDEESDYEAEAEEEEDFDLNTNPAEDKKKKSRSKRNKSDEESDYEVEAEEEEEDLDLDLDEDEDEDFTPDEEEEEEFLSIGFKRENNRKKKNKSRVTKRKKPSVTKNKKEKKIQKRGRKKKNNSEPVTKRRRRTALKELDEEEELLDDDFLEEDDDDEEYLIEERKPSKSLKRKSVSDSETSEFEFLTSESEDEAFEIQPQTHPKRRKKNRSGSDSSDSEYVVYDSDPASKPVPKRSRKLCCKGKSKLKEEKDENDSGRKICGICLNEEQKRTTPGVLDCCAHFFCFACIIEWSKVESRCPVCKRRFETITKASSSDSDDLGYGPPNKVIHVPKRDQVYQPTEEELRGMIDPYEHVVCMECQQGGDDNLMLLCDICDSSAHTYCVGLGSAVPEGNWYCDCCRVANISAFQQAETSSVPFTPFVSDSTAAMDLEEGPSVARTELEIDLNAPPVEEEGPSQVTTQSPNAGGAATVSNRRAIRQRIRILLSSARAMQIVVRQNGEGVSGSNGEHPREMEEGAKEKVRAVVRTQLRNLCVNSSLEHDAMKSVVRRATRAVLAACGIGSENRSRQVSGLVRPPPSNCVHEVRSHEESSILPNVCSACFGSFARDVVQNVLDAS